MSRLEINRNIVRNLRLPAPHSHKGENGRLLVVAGSERYHGSLIYAIKAASKIVDLVYVLTTPENRKFVDKLKEKTAEFISVNNLYPLSISPLARGRKVGVDCVLIGPGMGVYHRTSTMIQRVLKSGTKAVLDADALNVLDKKLLKLLGPKHILTPHAGEFRQLLSGSSTSLSPTSPNPSSGRRGIRKERRGGNEGAVKNFVKKYGCTIVLKGKTDIVCSPSPYPLPLKGARRGRGDGRGVNIGYNYTGNQGMTKGGTGDVLAGLIAAFYCKNDAFTSAAAGVYVNGLAGDALYKKVGPYYDAKDLVEQIPKTLWKIISNF